MQSRQEAQSIFLLLFMNVLYTGQQKSKINIPGDLYAAELSTSVYKHLLLTKPVKTLISNYSYIAYSL